MTAFQTAGALTLKALADNVNDVRGTVSNSLSADLRQCSGTTLEYKLFCSCRWWQPVCSWCVGTLKASEAADVIQLHWLTVKLGRLLWPVSSAQPADGGCLLQMCRTTVRWRSPVTMTQYCVRPHLRRRMWAVVWWARRKRLICCHWKSST